MSTASDRKWRRKRRELKELAENNPAEFKKEWAKKLESWRDVAKIRARRLGRFEGIAVQPAFELVENALRKLQDIGDVAVALEAGETKQILLGECTSAVAQQVDYRLNKLGKNYAQNR